MLWVRGNVGTVKMRVEIKRYAPDCEICGAGETAETRLGRGNASRVFDMYELFFFGD